MSKGMSPVPPFGDSPNHMKQEFKQNLYKPHHNISLEGSQASGVAYCEETQWPNPTAQIYKEKRRSYRTR